MVDMNEALTNSTVVGLEIETAHCASNSMMINTSLPCFSVTFIRVDLGGDRNGLALMPC